MTDAVNLSLDEDDDILPEEAAPIRVLLVDDHQIIRDGLSASLALHGFEVVGESDNGLDALRKAQALHPELVILDVDLPGRNGLDVLADLLKMPGEPPKVLILSMFGDHQFADQVLSQGASGYVHKSAGLKEVITAAEAIAAGAEHVGGITQPGAPNPTVAIREEAAHVELPKLSRREREVLKLLAEGRSAKQTASDMDITPATVHVYRMRLREKLGVNSLAALMRLAIRLGLAGIEK